MPQSTMSTLIWQVLFSTMSAHSMPWIASLMVRSGGVGWEWPMGSYCL